VNVWFHDNLVIAGPEEDLLRALQVIQVEGPPLGLNLAPAKSRIWCSDLQPDNNLPLGSNIPRANTHSFELLGAPVGEGHFSTSVIEKRIAKIHDLVISKLPTLQDRQSEYVLLRSCIGLPKFAFSLQTCDPIHHAASFRSFDGIICDSLSIILGKTMDDHQWTQATLPVSLGGLGIRSAAAHAVASYTSSVAQTGPLVSSIASTSNATLLEASAS
jgi:hypothetical protein